MSALCIVMARGGSKRVPRKNVRILQGKPLVAWPTATAVRCGIFDKVLISTENAEIADAAVQAGAIYPFVRPLDVSDDFATTADVLRVTLKQWQEFSGELPDYCCCLYGTSIFVTQEHLKLGYEFVKQTECVMAVTQYAHPIQRAVSLSENNEVNYLQPEFALIRTQDCPKTYHDVGLFYFFSVRSFFEHGATSFVPLKKRAVVVSSTEAVDIDTEEDFNAAEALMIKQAVDNKGLS